MNIEEIKNCLVKARKVFELHGAEISRMFLSEYPNGCCGSSSDIVGTWLITKGAKDLEYVHGKRGEHSHGWLEYEGWILDITSDQFEDGCDPVFISRSSTFHDSFEDQERTGIGLSPVLVGPYNKFLAHIEHA